MRYLLFLALLANVALFAYGQGFLGVPPADNGRDPRPLSQRNQHALVLEAPMPTTVNQR